MKESPYYISKYVLYFYPYNCTIQLYFFQRLKAYNTICVYEKKYSFKLSKYFIIIRLNVVNEN